MKFLQSHILLMLIYALLTSAFFALLWKKDQRERIRFFILVSLGLFFGGITLAWVMFPFPLR